MTDVVFKHGRTSTETRSVHTGHCPRKGVAPLERLNRFPSSALVEGSGQQKFFPSPWQWNLMTTDEILRIPADLPSPAPHWKGKDTIISWNDKGRTTRAALISNFFFLNG